MVKCHFLIIYRSSNQTQDEFESFPKSYGWNLHKVSQQFPEFFVALYNFNAKWNITWTLDISSPCIDLLITSQPDLIDWGVPISIHPNCHYEIIFTRFPTFSRDDITKMQIQYYQMSYRQIWLGKTLLQYRR